MRIGKDPWHSGAKFFLDELRIYTAVLKSSSLINQGKEIVAMAAPAMVMWGESYTVFGCDSCNYFQALSSCPDKYHLCSVRELYEGGYHIGRIMGWFRSNVEVWTRVTDPNDPTCKKPELDDPNIYKLAICCQNKKN